MQSSNRLREEDPGLCKLLSDTRDRYIEQSRKTVAGRLAPLPPRSEPASRGASLSTFTSATKPQ